MNPANGGWIILLTLLIALVLAIAHLPDGLPEWIGWLRPAWVPLVVFYWAMAVPHRMGLISAWLMGLVLDVAAADPLGLNAVVLATFTYIAWRFSERLRMYTIAQQSGLVFILVLAAEAVQVIVQDLAFDRGLSVIVVLPGVVSTLLWPFLYVVLERLRFQFRVD